jgi:glucose-6-phosphate 1-dehydrogenase
MFQMLAYLCMEVPGSFESNAIRNEKAKLLEAVRVYTPEEVQRYVVRGQYGPEVDETGKVLRPGYRQEKDVDPQSKTETFAAARFHIDNWRWEGVPIYLRSGKALWKRGTEIIVEFKKAPPAMFRNTPVREINPNRLIFHIQPYQGIEVQFQAKIPGPTLQLQPVNMRFGYADAFKASRYTGYEVMIYSCTHGDATLFSRGDLVEAAWRVAQPLLDYWKTAPAEFPNYARGTWGPTEAADLIDFDGRHWFELISEDVLKKVAIFNDGDPMFLSQVILALRPQVAAAGELLIRMGDLGREMYVLVRGTVEILDATGNVLTTLKDGACFGELALLINSARTASVRARTGCDLLVLDAAVFSRILHDFPHFAESSIKIARERYNLEIAAETLLRRPPR